MGNSIPTRPYKYLSTTEIRQIIYPYYVGKSDESHHYIITNIASGG